MIKRIEEADIRQMMLDCVNRKPNGLHDNLYFYYKSLNDFKTKNLQWYFNPAPMNPYDFILLSYNNISLLNEIGYLKLYDLCANTILLRLQSNFIPYNTRIIGFFGDVCLTSAPYKD